MNVKSLKVIVVGCRAVHDIGKYQITVTKLNQNFLYLVFDILVFDMVFGLIFFKI